MSDSTEKILAENKWRCSAQRALGLRPDILPHRCTVVGSEILVIDGRTFCPSCAGRLAQGHQEPLISPIRAMH